MKICLCITRIKSDLTEAISKNFFKLSEELAKDNEVTVYSPIEIKVPKNTKLVKYSNNHSYESKFTVLKNIKKLGNLIDKEKNNYDIIHFHVGFLLEAYLLSKLIKKSKTPLLITIWQPYLSSKELSKIAHFIIIKPKDYLYHFIMNSFFIVPFLAREIKKKYNKIIISSNFQKNQLLNFFPENKISKIPNGLEDSTIKKEVFENRSPNILYIGHFTSFKGIEPLIHSMSHIVKRYPEAKLTLAYSGYGSKNRVFELVRNYNLRNNIILKKKIDVYPELSKNDFLIIPYRSSIGTSHYHNVLLEAMSVGIPVLASNIGSIPEIIKDRETGILINPKKPKQIAKKVVETFQNKELLNNISKNQKKLFKESFLLKNITQKHIELYKRQNGNS
jgi:glycosyltransferase involved in cell wall biosynthesis